VSFDEWEPLPRIINPDGTVKHIIKDGSRYHVLSWSEIGTHCSEPECEINKQLKGAS
jgi:hypothetical protein